MSYLTYRPSEIDYERAPPLIRAIQRELDHMPMSEQRETSYKKLVHIASLFVTRCTRRMVGWIRSNARYPANVLRAGLYEEPHLVRSHDEYAIRNILLRISVMFSTRGNELTLKILDVGFLLELHGLLDEAEMQIVTLERHRTRRNARY